MILSVHPISDSTIVSMLAENNSSAWEQLYDKHAPVMYGAVFKMVKDEKMAKEIFKECFLQLKGNKNILSIRTDLCPFLLKYVNGFTLDYLKLNQQLVTEKVSYESDRFSQVLTSRHISVREEDFDITLEQKEARKKLREEFNQLREQHKRKVQW
ncbi:MAG: hypothetical protein H0W84_02835 [Bacteroidetes bacterium]|nr:hypothetical protein [Bacteroidota bacterium]